MKLFKRIIVIFVFMINCFTLNIHANNNSSLTIHYHYQNQDIEGLVVETYYIADYKNGNYTLSEEFMNFPINFDQIKNQNNWRELATTLASYIIANHMAPDYIGTSDEQGRVTFDNVKTGLYLTLSVNKETNESMIEFETFFTVIPYENDMIVKPKCTSYQIKYEELEYKIMKQWKDKSNIDHRPSSISVDVYKDGKFYSNVVLNDENNWTFSWKYKDDGSKFTVIEKNVDENYSVSIYEDKQVFIITNTYEGPPETPSTNDPMNIIFYIIAMSFSGLFFILLSLLLRKKEYE